MKKKILTHSVLALFAFLPLLVNAQGWQTLFPTSGRGQSVIQSLDGNLIFLGEDEVSGFGEVPRLHKTDTDGNVIWTQTYLSLNNSDLGNVMEMPNGELLIVGNKNIGSSNGPSDIFMLFTDASGNQIDINYLGGADYEYGNDIIQDANGNMYVIGGTSSSGNGLIDCYVIKFNATGAIVWEKVFGFAGYDVANTAEVLPDGGLLMLGWTQVTPGGPSDLYLIRIDADGNEVFSKIDYGTRNGDLCPTADGNFFLATTTPGQFNQPDVMVVKLDPDGNEIWSQTYVIPEMQDPNSIELTADGGFIIAGRTNNSGSEVILLKGDASGNLEFENRTAVGQLEWAEDVAVLNDGGFAFCGRGNVNFTRMFIGRTDSQGSVYSNTVKGRFILDDINDDCVLDSNPKPADTGVTFTKNGVGQTLYIYNDGLFEITLDTGTYQVAANTLYGNPNLHELCQPLGTLTLNNFYETTDLGDILFRNNQSLPTEIISGYVFYDANGNCEFDAGEVPLECATVPYAPEGQPETVFSAETDENGYYEVEVPVGGWYYPGGFFWWDNFWNCDLGTCTIDGGYVTSGQTFTQDIALQCGPDIGVLAGTIFLDENNDCLYDTLNEEILFDWEVVTVNTASNDTTTFASVGNGVYNFLLNPGTYEVFVLLPNATWQTCTNPHLVTVDNGCHTGFDFPIQPADVCPLLEVDISTGNLRPCFQSTYFMQYCNLGSETATDAYIEVTLDSAMEFVSSPFPVTQMGQVLTFDLGDIEPLECQTIDFKIFLDCDAEVGLTHCVEAHIYPDTTCVPLNPLWDMSSVQLSGKCEGDSLTFKITNVGLGNMTQTQDYIVIEDNVLIRSDQFILPSGEDSAMVFYPEGATLRMEAEQSAFHPGNSMPSITLEGCGTNVSGGISTGFVIQMPENDLDPFVSIECLESGASFDPNDKQGFPRGVGENHFIRPNTELEYKIRFQNTGTAPALNVVIRDTLSSFLDAGNLRPGVSSHDYEFELENGNVAVFTFEGINLPDSTSNFAESMGFVKFKIPQITDNQPGTQILNSAAIYFDFNPPILTNVTEHQIPFPVEEHFFASEICLGEQWMGFEITEDTTFSETVNFSFFVEETTYEITALDHVFFEQNISLIEGQTFNEIVITSDTTIIENLTAANGCDSTATTYITVLPNSVSNGIFGLSATIFPNPTSGVFYLEMQLTEDMELSLSLTDVLGRKVSQIFNNQYFAAGKNQHKVEVGNLPEGIYHLHLRGGNGVWTSKVHLK